MIHAATRQNRQGLAPLATRCRPFGALLIVLFVVNVSVALPLQDVLTASGWPPGRIASLQAGDDVSLEDEAQLLQLADSLGRFAARIREDAEAPAGDETVRAVVLSGEVQRVESSSAEAFRCVFGHDGKALEVIVSHVPDAWRQEGVLPQPAEVLALQIAPARLLAIEWHWSPDAPHYPYVNFGESVLGSLGVNVGALDRVRDGGPLRAIESAPFYEVLSATRQVGAHQLARFARGNLPRYAEQWDTVRPEDPPARQALADEVKRVTAEGSYPIAPLFNDAVHQRGELYLLDGLCRRCVAIETGAAAGSGPSVSREYGVDRYYELEVFTPDSRNLPVVVCVLEVPAGFPQGDNLSVPVRVAGFSFKRWAYRTRQKTDTGGDKAQLAPLLVGRAPILLAEPAGDPRWGGLAIGGAFALALGVVWWTVWRTAQSDAQFEQAARRRTAPPVDPAAFDSLASLDENASLPDNGPQATEP